MNSRSFQSVQSVDLMRLVSVSKTNTFGIRVGEAGRALPALHNITRHICSKPSKSYHDGEKSHNTSWIGQPLLGNTLWPAPNSYTIQGSVLLHCAAVSPCLVVLRTEEIRKTNLMLVKRIAKLSRILSLQSQSGCIHIVSSQVCWRMTSKTKRSMHRRGVVRNASTNVKCRYVKC